MTLCASRTDRRDAELLGIRRSGLVCFFGRMSDLNQPKRVKMTYKVVIILSLLTKSRALGAATETPTRRSKRLGREKSSERRILLGIVKAGVRMDG